MSDRLGQAQPPFSGIGKHGRPTASVFNPPGRSALDYRIGTYRSLLRAMVERMRSSRCRHQVGQGGHKDALPRGLAHSDSDNWVLSLMKSWATVGDVLAFYQERIANEGFLRTAVEERSLRELALMIDYVGNPAIAARGQVAFQVARTKGMIERVLVPSGTKLMSLPVRSRLPEHFQTLSDLEARREWNAMHPRIPSDPIEPFLLGSATALDLRGARTGLKVGDAVVISGRWASDDASSDEPARYFRRLSEVVPIRTEPIKVVALAADQDSKSGSNSAEPSSKAKSASARRLPAAKQRTRIGWVRPLRAGEPADELHQVGVLSLRRQAHLFGYDAPQWRGLASKIKRKYQPILGGVQVSEDGGDGWQSHNVNLPEKPLRAIVAGPDGSLYVAVAGAGIYRLPAQGGAWEPVNQGLSKKDVHALAVEASGFLLAGATDGAVFRSVDSGGSWQAIGGSILKKSGSKWKAVDTRLPRVTVRSLEKVDEEWGSFLFAGTDQGVYRSSDESAGWEPANQGLPETSASTGASKLVVHSVVSGDRPGLLFIGSKSGVFTSCDIGGSWSPANHGLPDTDSKGLTKTEVFQLEVYSDQRAGLEFMVAATSKGVYRSLDRGRTWKASNRGIPKTEPATGVSKTAVRSLTRAWDPQALTTDLFAATAAGLFRSNDHGVSWERIAQERIGENVTALGSAGKDKLIVAEALGGFSASEWPGFRLSGGRVDISGVQPKILPGGWIAIVEERDGKEPLEGIYRVESVDTALREDFTLKETVTRVRVDAGDELGLFDLRRAKVFLHAEQREVYLEERVRRNPLAVGEIDLDVLLDPAPEAGRSIIVRGKRMRVRIHSRTVMAVKGADRTQTLEAGHSSIVETSAAAGGSKCRLGLRLSSGVAGVITLSPDDFTWTAALDIDSEVAEPTTVSGVQVVERTGSTPTTKLLLEPPLTHCFDPETVTVFGNVTTAVAGETVPEDVLGSGSSAKAHQGFALRKPLTYDLGNHGLGPTPTLSVTVNDVEWSETATLFDCGPRDEVFMVREDAQGRPHLIFGDGVRGARLPTGHDNVVASYRSGNSAAGVAAGHLKMLRTRPVGLQSVSNPMPVESGVPAEGSDGIRRRAPLSMRALGRAVSFDDYRDVAKTFPGVVDSWVASFWTECGQLVHVTIAPAMDEVDPDGSGKALSEELRRYLSRNRLGNSSLAVEPATIRSFGLGVRLLVERRQDAKAVEKRARKKLEEAFTGVAGDCESPVTPADFVAVLQGVTGVAVVEPISLFWSEDEKALSSSLELEPATLVAGEVSPAQVATLDKDRVEIEIEVAP